MRVSQRIQPYPCPPGQVLTSPPSHRILLRQPQMLASQGQDLLHELQQIVRQFGDICMTIPN